MPSRTPAPRLTFSPHEPRGKVARTEAGIATPACVIPDSPVELERFLTAYPSALLKPASGGRGSAGVSRARIGDPRNREPLDKTRLASNSDRVCATEFLAGEEYPIDGVVRDGVFQMLSLGRKSRCETLAARHREAEASSIQPVWPPRPALA